MGRLDVVGEGGEVIGALESDVEESFSLETFEQLITEAEQAGKHFILARVATRDKENPLAVHHDYYAASSLNRLLFKRRRGELVHRYHRTSPVFALNPLTNSEILGEVVYFLVGDAPPEPLAEPDVENPQQNEVAVSASGVLPRSCVVVPVDGTGRIEEGGEPSVSSPGTAPSRRRAEFFCTDFNLAYSESFRQLFSQNIVDPSSAEIGEDVHASGDSMEGDAELLGILARLGRVIEQRDGTSFSRGVIFGGLVLVYIQTAAVVIGGGVMALIGSGGNLEWGVWLFFPFVSMLLERTIHTLFRARERQNTTAVKISVWVGFIALPYVVTTSPSSHGYVVGRSVLNIVFPILATVYYVMTFRRLQRQSRLG